MSASATRTLMARSPDRMTPQELRASVSLATLFAMRMLGLFLILPVFAVHARGLPGGDDALWVGLALGIYGLTQGLLQLPFGAASDRFGRKPVIVAGLLLFAAGSFVAAAATDVAMTVVGRALQGAGAISAAVTAFIADSTRESQRTKAMAMVGASIGLTFAVSLVAAPALYPAIGMGGIFAVTGALALGGIALVAFAVPAASPAATPAAGDGRRRTPLRHVLLDSDLMRLNYGIFALHLAMMAMFVVLPVALVERLELPLAQHWKVYLPVVLVSFAVMMPPLNWAERNGRLRLVFLTSIVVLLAVSVGYAIEPRSLVLFTVLLLAFFVGFNLLEALLPSLVSRLAPADARGTALGVYTTTQSLGLFAGGLAGGWIAARWGAAAVFGFSAALMATWFLVAHGATRWGRPKTQLEEQ